MNLLTKLFRPLRVLVTSIFGNSDKCVLTVTCTQVEKVGVLIELTPRGRGEVGVLD